MLVFCVIEEGAEARPRQLGAGVGDRLQQRAQVEGRGQRLAGAVDHLEHALLVAQRFLDAGAPHHLAGMARHVLGQRGFLVAPVAHALLVQVEDGRQAPLFDQRHDDHRARVDAGIAVRIRRRVLVQGDIVQAQGAPAAQLVDDGRPEAVEFARFSRQAGDAAVGPVAVHAHQASGAVDLAVADPRHAEVFAGQLARGLHHVHRVDQAAQRVAQLQVEGMALLGEHARGAVGQHEIHADDLAIVAYRGDRGREVAPFQHAVAVELQQRILELGRLARQGFHDVGLQARPEFRTHQRKRLAHGAGMLVAQQGGIGVVIEQPELRPPGDRHRKLRGDDQVGDGLHAFWPIVGLYGGEDGPGTFDRLAGQRRATFRKKGETAFVTHQDSPGSIPRGARSQEWETCRRDLLYRR